ncbi:hypothetical protein Aglo03_11130 [Actinokineospora globicatena]|uniref:Uncharacterized protein n=1 Tax=Actinokineospora globicatena TaxID=103729 RepID=A0A9W6QIW2_9PSEU|nr:hypothetical protein Aglo03_11130 [Actinokineospora globicatena]
MFATYTNRTAGAATAGQAGTTAADAHRETAAATAPLTKNRLKTLLPPEGRYRPAQRIQPRVIDNRQAG